VPEEGFSPRFPFSRIGDYHVKIVPETRHGSHTYRGGGVAAAAAAQP